MLFYDGIKVYMQNGKLDDVEIAYYINGYVTTNS